LFYKEGEENEKKNEKKQGLSLFKIVINTNLKNTYLKINLQLPPIYLKIGYVTGASNIMIHFPYQLAGDVC
jgi:hypothetical protein